MHDVLGWAARNSSKVGRDFSEDSWTVHATPRWSEEFLELDKDEAANILYNGFLDIIGSSLPEPLFMTAHRWRYAQTVTPLGQPYLADESNTLFFGGDWCLRARVEYAFESGSAIAEAILALHD